MRMPELALPRGVDLVVADSAQEVAGRLAAAVASELEQALAGRGRASLAVSGGATPRPFFEALSRKALDWRRVDVLLADERWVDVRDDASNTRLVRAHLLQHQAASANYVSLKQSGDSPEAGLAAVEAALAQVAWPLDMLVLGMGADGHTASLFPDAPELPEALAPGGGRRVCAVHPPSQRQARVTLTLPVLVAARSVALHIRGEDKLDTLRAACEHPGDIASMPVRAFLKPGLRIFWSP